MRQFLPKLRIHGVELGRPVHFNLYYLVNDPNIEKLVIHAASCVFILLPASALCLSCTSAAAPCTNRVMPAQVFRSAPVLQRDTPPGDQWLVISLPFRPGTPLRPARLYQSSSRPLILARSCKKARWASSSAALAASTGAVSRSAAKRRMAPAPSPPPSPSPASNRLLWPPGMCRKTSARISASSKAPCSSRCELST